MKEKDLVIEKCAHCGDDCGHDPIVFQEENFCCEGCKTVYEIFQSNDLCDYYTLNDRPGIKTETEKLNEKYAFLDAEEVKQKLLDFTDGTIEKVKFFTPKIHCSSCIWLLENLQKLDEGVSYSTVNFPKKEVIITFNNQKTSLKKLVVLMATIGYEPQINLASKNQQKLKNKNRSVSIKIGVAGFCFGNIMLMSFPDYLDSADGLGEFAQLFGYFNIMLVLPVVFYSAQEYFVSAFKGLRSKNLNIDVPIALGIVVLFLRSVYEIISHTGAGYLDSLAGLVFFLLIGKWYQGKTYKALSFDRDYTSYFPLALNRIKNGVEEVILADHIQPNDELFIRNNELIPVDGELVDGIANIDYSFVTGESNPIHKQLGEKLYAGGRQIGEGILVKAKQKVSKSYLTELWNQEIFAKQKDQGFKNLLDRFSQYFTAGILLVAFFTGLYWYFINPALIFTSVTAVLIVACPCALALSLPFALGNSMRVLGKFGVFVKSTNTVEKLASTNAIVFDKTGTITQSQQSRVNFVGKALTREEKSYIRSVVKNSTHPLSMAIYQFIDEPALQVFDFVEVAGKGIAGMVNHNHILVGSASFTNSVKEDADLNKSKVFISINNSPKGYFEIKKEYRKGLKNLLNQLKKTIQIHLLTGDGEGEKGYLEKLFPQAKNLRFNQTPEQKLNYINQLNLAGYKTLMIGDGLNDAGALQAANVGISISDDVYTFSPACDVIMDSKAFEKLNAMIDFSKQSMKVVKFSLVLSIMYNLVGLFFAVQGLLSPLFAALLMPLSSVTVVGFVVLMTNYWQKVLIAKN